MLTKSREQEILDQWVKGIQKKIANFTESEAETFAFILKDLLEGKRLEIEEWGFIFELIHHGAIS